MKVDRLDLKYNYANGVAWVGYSDNGDYVRYLDFMNLLNLAKDLRSLAVIDPEGPLALRCKELLNDDQD